VSESLKLKIESMILQVEDKLKILSSYIEKCNFNQQIVQLKSESEREDFWSDNIKAASILENLSSKQNFVKTVDRHQDTYSWLKLALDSGESLSELDPDLEELLSKVEKVYIETLFDGEYDDFACFITVTAGSGGLEAQDWAEILFEMYNNFVRTSSIYKGEVLDYVSKDVGIKSGLLKVTGTSRSFPYGRLKGENGVHRLVRPSPFNANNNRHTSFASVIISPVIDDKITINIVESDLRIDTYRASGAGGQHVNKTDSAVRITHLPTGIVAQCQNDRSQHRNKAEAMSILRSRLYSLAEEEKKKGAQVQKDSISWGNQIRSYVLDDSRVKDLRTGVESPRPEKVLAGDIDMFLDAYIKWLKG